MLYPYTDHVNLFAAEIFQIFNPLHAGKSQFFLIARHFAPLDVLDFPWAFGMESVPDPLHHQKPLFLKNLVKMQH